VSGYWPNAHYFKLYPWAHERSATSGV
jgi:hypothetical protein